jgi:hypothetical protein
MDTLLQDLRYTLRTLSRQWLFTVTAVLTLALGIGANTATFSLVDAVLLRPLPYAAPEQLVVVWGEHPNIHRETASLPDFNDWRSGGSAFSELAALAFTSLNLSGDGEPERVPAVRATSNFFTLFGVAPVLGRIAVGLVGAWVLTRWMGSLLYEVSAVDVPTYVGVALFLAVVALVATWLPARRATRVPPSEALRQE